VAVSRRTGKLGVGLDHDVGRVHDTDRAHAGSLLNHLRGTRYTSKAPKITNICIIIILKLIILYM